MPVECVKHAVLIVLKTSLMSLSSFYMCLNCPLEDNQVDVAEHMIDNHDKNLEIVYPLLGSPGPWRSKGGHMISTGMFPSEFSRNLTGCLPVARSERNTNKLKARFL